MEYGSIKLTVSAENEQDLKKKMESLELWIHMKQIQRDKEHKLTIPFPVEITQNKWTSF